MSGLRSDVPRASLVGVPGAEAAVLVTVLVAAVAPVSVLAAVVSGGPAVAPEDYLADVYERDVGREVYPALTCQHRVSDRIQFEEVVRGDLDEGRARQALALF